MLRALPSVSMMSVVPYCFLPTRYVGSPGKSGMPPESTANGRMMTTASRAALLALLLLGSGAAAAQEAPPETAAPEAASETLGPDYAAWDEVAERAEEILAS